MNIHLFTVLEIHDALKAAGCSPRQIEIWSLVPKKDWDQMQSIEDLVKFIKENDTPTEAQP